MDFFGWRCCGLCRPNKVDWTKEFELNDATLSNVISNLDEFKRPQNYLHSKAGYTNHHRDGGHGHSHTHQHSSNCKHNQHSHQAGGGHQQGRENFQFVWHVLCVFVSMYGKSCEESVCKVNINPHKLSCALWCGEIVIHMYIDIRRYLLRLPYDDPLLNLIEKFLLCYDVNVRTCIDILALVTVYYIKLI